MQCSNRDKNTSTPVGLPHDSYLLIMFVCMCVCKLASEDVHEKRGHATGHPARPIEERKIIRDDVDSKRAR